MKENITGIVIRFPRFIRSLQPIKFIQWATWPSAVSQHFQPTKSKYIVKSENKKNRTKDIRWRLSAEILQASFLYNHSQ